MKEKNADPTISKYASCMTSNFLMATSSFEKSAKNFKFF